MSVLLAPAHSPRRFRRGLSRDMSPLRGPCSHRLGLTELSGTCRPRPEGTCTRPLCPLHLVSSAGVRAALAQPGAAQGRGLSALGPTVGTGVQASPCSRPAAHPGWFSATSEWSGRAQPRKQFLSVPGKEDAQTLAAPGLSGPGGLCNAGDGSSSREAGQTVRLDRSDTEAQRPTPHLHGQGPCCHL